MSSIQWGIIGCGDVTENKSGPGFRKAPGSALVAVMRRDAGKAEDYARRHGVARWYDNAELLIEDPEVDAVYIATPPALHLPYVLRVASARKPVYVEKPMGMNYAECVQMREACKEAGVPLFVSLYRRALPRFLKVKALVEGGAIGVPRCVSVVVHRAPQQDKRDWLADPAISGGGLFFDLAPHQVDLLDFILGPIVEASGRCANQGGGQAAEDIVSGTWVHANGTLGTGTWCFTTDHSREEIEIVGSAGRIRFAVFEDQSVDWWRGCRLERFNIANPQHVHQPLIESIVAELRGEGKSPSNGENGVRAAWVMDRLLGRSV